MVSSKEFLAPLVSKSTAIVHAIIATAEIINDFSLIQKRGLKSYAKWRRAPFYKNMKQSIYNHFVNLDGKTIVFNSLSNQFILLNQEVETTLDCKPKDSPITQMLLNKGFLVNDDICEIKLVKSFFFARKHSNRIYNLIINTTLECNLGCWYCYETHIKNSFLSLSLVDTIIEHLKIKASAEPFEVLELSFFGGEPMMNYRSIKKLLNNISTLSKESGYKVNLTFVTNGTFLNNRYVELLKPFTTRFQITIDGDEEMHNSVRTYKSPIANNGSYKKIIDGLKLFSSIDAEFYFTIRINYNNKVLANIDNLIKDLDFLNRKRTYISLHRIWQYSATKEDYTNLFNAIERINAKRFVVNSFRLAQKFESCYADNYNHAVINYNGKVFKCTARDFVKVNPEGELNSDGFIEWDTQQVNKRLSTQIPQKCIECSLLPCCPGICSQQLIEATDINSIECPFKDSISKENMILLNLKQKLIAKRNEAI